MTALRSSSDDGANATRPGKVYLVGAGPGDPGLITARGLQLLRTADVVAYDRLVAPQLLDEAPATAERIFVGRRAGEAHRDQSAVDAVLVENARAGKVVVRLKGGDPFVFGRGAEEARVLRDASIEYEIVPGVTSAIAVPAYAGIPVTQRGVARSFVVLTGHELGTEMDSLPWARLAHEADTIVLLMGVQALRWAARRLIEGGRSPDEPAAVIEWGTTPRQRTVVGPLHDIAARAADARIEPPATGVIGRVVATREGIQWFENRPLFGLRVVVTRSASQAPKLSTKLAEVGAEVLHVPTIAILDPATWSELDHSIQLLVEGYYKWVIFTSSNTVERFFGRLVATRHDARAFGRTRVAAVGTATADALETRGIRADLVPPKFTGDDLVRAIGHGTGGILIPRAANAPNSLVPPLRAVGWTPEEVVAYRNVAPRTPSAGMDAVTSGDFDVVTFTSASTARNFVKLAGAPGDLGLSPKDPPERLVACIGPVTAAEATKRGLRVDVVAEEHTAEGLVGAIVGAAPRVRRRARDGNMAP
ncbi:MAG TPA: uroporphyrinogen-III C-methyltransferase [Actinomycetota bacterium]|jgi:uroporphyrinogen III methyltransferase/synthase